MTWTEWERLKTAAGERQGATPAGELIVHQDDLGAVGHDAYMLWDDLRTVADLQGAGADGSGNGSTARAATTLTSHGFTTGTGLTKTLEIWTSQVKSVLQACAHISNHLDYSKRLHKDEDAKIGAQVAAADGGAVPVSELSKYFT
ncbi:hypothetical protein [Streptomyces acidiscabies]|uniref:hypothetical protein n=1 Tax=Streptomyces acidiscabies TaxID=42234 RepID=UPI0038F7EEC0